MHNSGQLILRKGQAAESAEKALLLLHGRGATASSIMTLSEQLPLNNFHIVAPQAKNNEWYPFSFLEDIKKNEAELSKSLFFVEEIIKDLEKKGLSRNKVFLFGFSQGACMAVEYLARKGGKYGAVFALSGGLIGKEINESKYSSNLESTRVFLGSGDKDGHIPVIRVEETAQVMSRLGANVETRIYKDMEHTINRDEIEYINSILLS